MDVGNDHVPRTTQTDELAALTAILMPEDAQPSPEPEFVAPPTPTQAVAAPQTYSAPPEPGTAPPPDPVSVPVPEPESAPAPVPTFTAKLSDDLQALLDEPDFEEEARAEVAAEAESDEFSYDDPETAARERAKDKRIQFLESQLVAKSKKGWVEEAKRAFPDLARLPGEIEGISASSRRGFIREANARNERCKVVFGPLFAQIDAERAAIATGAVNAAREEVAQAWGRPAADTLPPTAAAQADALQKARATGKLENQIKAMLQNPATPNPLP